MNLKTIQIIVRSILCLALLYGVYTETGKWTTISLFLIFLSTELLAYEIKVIKDLAKSIQETLEEISKE